MIKHQIHEEFASFTGVSIDELSKLVADFSLQQNVAVKSLSVIHTDGKLTASIGFRSDEAAYPIALWSKAVSLRSLDAELSAAEDEAPGDVLCHSLCYAMEGVIVVFLLHE